MTILKLLNQGLVSSAFVLALLATKISVAQSFHEDFSIWPVDLKINGTVVVCSGPNVDPAIEKIMIDGDKKQKPIVVYFDQKVDDKPLQSLLKREQGVKIFGQDAPLSKQNESELESLKTSLPNASVVVLLSSRALKKEAAALLEDLGEPLQKIIANGGLVCGVGPVVTHFGKFRHRAMPEFSIMENGINLIPDAIVHGGYDDQSDRPVLYSGIAMEPHSVAIGIPDNAGAVLRGRKFRAYGKPKVTFSITANERQSFRVQHLAPSKRGRRSNPYETVVDLTAWRRDAIERQLPEFPASKPPTPNVENGTLFIVGGGGMPKGLMQEFVDSSGGSEAHLIYVPCTENESVSSNQRIIRQWKSMGVASATVLHTKDRNRANTDQEFLKPLKRATGIWFGGGRQWNFVDSYYGTQAHKLMKEVLQRGGAIGGSSAGASVQGSYLARANPVANFDIMAPGYERGLGFLNGVAIDQHFSQRGRQKDMTQLANRYPQLLGIGIDEGTAIKVQGQIAEVVGKGKVFFYDRRKPVVPGQDDFLALESESKFNLAEREMVDSDPAKTSQQK